ncbi:MAG: acyltransferase [Cyanobacteria bacterium P01_H01_bin.74]
MIYLPALTSIRGILALYVVFYHFSDYFPVVRPAIQSVTHLLDYGYLAVDFFFLLSGFILAFVYHNKLAALKTMAGFFKFMTSRFARIYPLHFSVLLFLLTIESFKWAGIFPVGSQTPFTGSASVSAAVSNLFLLHSMGTHSILTWNGPSWSISAEWFAYLAFPLIAGLFLNSQTRQSVLYFVLFMAVLPLIAFLTGHSSLDITYDYGFLRCLPEFSAGIVLYRLYQLKIGSSLLATNQFLSVLVIFTLFLMHVGVIDWALIPFFGLSILSLAHNDTVIEKGGLSQILGLKPFHFIGEISYSIYLTHMAVFVVCFKLFAKLTHTNPADLSLNSALFVCVLMTGIIIFISTLTYRCIEAPLRKMIVTYFSSVRQKYFNPRHS